MLARLRERLVAVEREWLGWAFPPPGRAVAESGWRADDPSGYCGRCGSAAGAGEVSPGGCGSCRKAPVVTDAVVRLGAYAGTLREWVRAIKYRGWAEMAELLGHRLGQALRARLGDGAGPIVVVAMPMPWQRRLYRGLDHAALIADAASCELGTRRLGLLAMENGPPQVSLGASRRARRAMRFHIRRRYRDLRLTGIQVALIDDVRTTGASLNAAARVIRRLGPRRVVAGVLAVTEDRSRLPQAAGTRQLPESR